MRLSSSRRIERDLRSTKFRLKDFSSYLYLADLRLAILKVFKMSNEGNDGKILVKPETKSYACRRWTLQNSDQPGMALVSSHLNGSNYLSWSLAVRTALEAKYKLGFVDGSIKTPENPIEFKKWKPVDSMIKSWLTNSLTKELSESFIFCNSAKELWDSIAERYYVNNGPKFYQIQRQTVSLEQGSDSMTGYFNKMNRCWDELNRIKPVPKCFCGSCTCEVNKILDEHDSDIKLCQFLNGLHLMYDALRGQIMNLDPLPIVNKAFSMVVRQETQKEVNLYFNNVECSAMLARTGNNRNESVVKRNDDRRADKNSKFCDHYNLTGQTRDTCFKIVGFPDWYKELKEQRKKARKKNMAANALADTPIEPTKVKENIDFSGVLTALQEIAKMVKSKADEQVNFANFGEFAGKTTNSTSVKIDKRSWIIDTGASSHMCSNKNLMIDLRILNNKIPVHLPDGTKKNVEMIGNVIISSKIKLVDVFYILDFKYNLLSVNKMAKTCDVSVIFDGSHCVVQDQKTRSILIQGKMAGNLYVLRQIDSNKSLGGCDLINFACNTLNRNSVSDVDGSGQKEGSKQNDPPQDERKEMRLPHQKWYNCNKLMSGIPSHLQEETT
ncbi:uncharacterized protein G2W53_044551 [Senna tora]|uniref:Retrotransposon Copia-like N-terminal domain-containing protein n=1 Tax=Senna tora TaxID=362788 RepID=A0A834SER2_9FABA|nr:uncharacterized protein G2W53_044551 [Senna tora]